MKRNGWLLVVATAAALAIPVLVFCAPTGPSVPIGQPNSMRPAPSAALDLRHPEAVRPERYIVVDQFGYLPGMPKVAILADPELGWNKTDLYEPGSRFEVRDAESGSVAFEAGVAPFKGGAVDEVSGDRGYWFDFSALRKPGRYFVYDPKNECRSDEFRIGDDAYTEVLKAALRAFYFNRANFAKVKPYACAHEKCWISGEDYTGPGQDKAARSVLAEDKATTERDLSGGFWDAGDVNKYVSFAYAPLHQLLSAYEQNPSSFGDDLNIPESGNTVPDLLDLVLVELEFLKKMQATDLEGGVLAKVGNIAYGDPEPEASKLRRFYYPGSCSSAVISVASVFSHAALVFRGVPQLSGSSSEFLERARRAFSHYQRNPRSDACDNGKIRSGDADVPLDDQDQRALSAAIYLSEQDNSAAFQEVIAQHFRKSRLMKEDRLAVYDAPIADALLRYATRSTGSDPAIAEAILERARHLSKTSDVVLFAPEQSLYRNQMRKDSYHWGSNQARANVGNSALLPVVFGFAAPDQREGLWGRAAEILHYFHGQNPLQLVMLSNMQSYGASRSVSEIYHAWFRDGSQLYDSAVTSTLGPAPGYVVGGVNPSYCSTESDHRCFVSEFRSQPIEKAYVDTNTGWEPLADFDMSWALSEPAIYYQAAYVKLLSQFVGEPRGAKGK